VSDAGPSGGDVSAVVVALSHELRSPLVSLRGFTRLLLDRWDRLSEDDRRELLTQIDHDASRVGRLVDELLDVSRIDAGRLVLHRTPVDLGALAEAVVRRVALAHPDLRGAVEVDADVPLVPADADRIEQVLTNLVENGAKYATADRLTVRVARHGSAGTVVVAVADEGPGLTAADRVRVFERFAGASGGRPSGLGLGLWIARSIADAHGGSLAAEANAHGGTTFRLTLPLSIPTD
jgi:signal transduction histidine kinase